MTGERCSWFGSQAQQMSDGNWIRPLFQEILVAEREARLAKHLEPEVGFVERLVLFWNNHFSVFRGKHSLVQATAGHMERSVIRKHVLGSFSDMLKGVIQHPAMIFYLDNDKSVGPNSKTGKAQRKSYNENLAREILELHTLGVYGGYEQEDVENLAKIITGWTIYPLDHPTKRGQFLYDPDTHEPGGFTIMKQYFAEGEQDQGLAVLDMLANHQSTAQHISFKLLQHFVTDNPSKKMVQSLARVFIRTKGNLKQVAAEMLNMTEAWSQPMTRIRQPYPWLVSMLRGLALTQAQVVREQDTFGQILRQLNHQLWDRITPDGYPDENYYWQNPDAVRLRKNAARRLVERSVYSLQWKGPKPLALANDLLNGSLTPASAEAIRSLPDVQALNMLFVTPEYLRR